MIQTVKMIKRNKNVFNKELKSEKNCIKIIMKIKISARNHVMTMIQKIVILIQIVQKN